MAFPQVAATNYGNSGGSITDHVISLPDGYNTQGHLLMVFIGFDGAPTASWPSGWTQVFSAANGSNCKLECRYRVADGSETATITVTTGSSEASGWRTVRITGHDASTNAPQAGTAATGSSSSPDPPSLTPTGGAKDYLWYATIAVDSDEYPTAYPTNYTNGVYDGYSQNIHGAGCGTCRREYNASSENPGTFTLNGSEDWVAQTVAVHPGTEGGGPTPNAFNKLAFASEPPTPNTWNQIAREAGTGWKKLLYEGE